jgi:hypothetical protein
MKSLAKLEQVDWLPERPPAWASNRRKLFSWRSRPFPYARNMIIVAVPSPASAMSDLVAKR